MKQSILPWMLGVAAIIFIGSLLLRQHSVVPVTERAAVVLPVATTTTSWLAYNHDQTIEYWTKRIDAEGDTAAYKEFSSQVIADSDPHDRAHEFGAALYITTGLPSITTCDGNFQYGCFHEFIGRAVATTGLPIIKQIDQFCQTSKGPAGCQHGIGHGLIGYEGYDLPGLKAALTDCATLTKVFPYQGCYAGAFMEFNTRIMLGDNKTPRPVANNDNNYPCNVLDTQYQSVCAYMQPSWWAQILLLKGTTSDAARLGDLCRRLNLGIKTQFACFAGIGVRAVDDQTFYKDAQSVATLCDSAGATLSQKLMCRSMAAGYLYATVGKSAALAPCEGLMAGSAMYCDTYATGKMSFVHPQLLTHEFDGTL